MEICRSSYKFTAPQVVALGNFDGVHLGHRALILKCISFAKKKNIQSAVCTFETHPKKVFTGSAELITDLDEKIRRIASLGADRAIIEQFDNNYAVMTPEEFIKKILFEKFGCAAVVCGENYRFGAGGRGDTQQLRSLCAHYGIEVLTAEAVRCGDEVISSSLIRGLIRDGQIETANELLGEPFSLTSVVGIGKQLGRTIGLPTINLSFREDSVIPAHGVYAARVMLCGREYTGAANIGVRPTVDGSGVNAEINLFDFDGDLYGQTVRAQLCAYIRPERRFESLEELKLQIIKDKSDIANYFKF